MYSGEHYDRAGYQTDMCQRLYSLNASMTSFYAEQQSARFVFCRSAVLMKYAGIMLFDAYTTQNK